jgi:hypothetical protein
VPDGFRGQTSDAGVGSGDESVLRGGQLLKFLIRTHAHGS